MALTKEEIEDIRRSWAPVIAKPEDHGAIFLKTFLDKHNYYYKFERFKDFPRDRIEENGIFRNHAKKIVTTLDLAIQNLHNLDALVPLLTGLGEGHEKRQIQLVQFEEFKVVVLDILVSFFKITDAEKSAWNKLFECALPIISKGLLKNTA